MVSQNVTLQIEATCELTLAPLFRAQKLFLFTRVDVQLVLVQEPGLVKHPFAAATWHLGYKNESIKQVEQLVQPPLSVALVPLCSFLCFRYSVHVFVSKGHAAF